MREALMMVIVLTVVCMVSALSLTLINNFTHEKITEQKQKETLKAINASLPVDQLHYNNDPSKDKVNIPEWTEKDGTPVEIYLAKRHNEIVGIAFKSNSEGYSGSIKIMIGIDKNEKILGIEIIEHHETPGLGSKIENTQFKDHFKGKIAENSQDRNLSIIKGRNAKYNWEIEALTGATISSIGVVNAINDGMSKFRQYRSHILGEY
ncbi:TPA: RnfABCDGE type electron transport complex subunit G [bacterium]|nr:RnfABCDGE type electron transport complex subunit G [bacterium]